MAKTALLLIDLQNDYFEGGKWPLHDTDKAAAQAVKLLSAFRAAGHPVVHVRHEFEGDDAPFFIPGSEGAAIHSALAPVDGEPIVLKHQINGFRETNLKGILDELGVTKLVVVGAMSHICIDAAVRAAADYGYEVVVAQDACATHEIEFKGQKVPAEQVHASFMAALAFGYATVVESEALLATM